VETVDAVMVDAVMVDVVMAVVEMVVEMAVVGMVVVEMVVVGTMEALRPSPTIRRRRHQVSARAPASPWEASVREAVAAATVVSVASKINRSAPQRAYHVIAPSD